MNPGNTWIKPIRGNNVNFLLFFYFNHTNKETTERDEFFHVEWSRIEMPEKVDGDHRTCHCAALWCTTGE